MTMTPRMHVRIAAGAVIIGLAAACSQQPTPRGALAEFRDHDEPLVVDNRPLKIRRGYLKKDASNGYRWTRNFTSFQQIVFFLDHANEDMSVVDRKLVSGIDRLEIDVRSGSLEDTLTFSAAGTMLTLNTGMIVFEEYQDQDFEYYLRPTQGRQYKVKKFRVHFPSGSVPITDKCNNSDPMMDGCDKKYRGVKLVILPKPE